LIARAAMERRPTPDGAAKTVKFYGLHP